MTECLRAISIIMLGRDGDPSIPLPSRPTRPRCVTTPLRQPVCHPPVSPLRPPPPCLLFAGSPCFFPRWCCVFFCDTDSLSGSLKVCVFFPRVLRLADSPTRLLHQQPVGWGLGRHGCLRSIHLLRCYRFLLSGFMMAMAATAPEPLHLCLWCCNRPRLQSDTRVCVLREEMAEPGSNSHMGLYSRPAGDFWINVVSFI